jgi:hypothetical protein
MGWIASSSEHESTRTSGGGQFHKFGAVEKFLATDFSHRHGSRKFPMKSFQTILERTISTGHRNAAEICPTNFHSGCTGNAENPVPGPVSGVVPDTTSSLTFFSAGPKAVFGGEEQSRVYGN